jgi:hypothetical protein
MSRFKLVSILSSAVVCAVAALVLPGGGVAHGRYAVTLGPHRSLTSGLMIEM